MNFGRQLVVAILAWALLFNVSCTKKKPQLPTQAKAPADTESVPLPTEISKEAPPPPPPAPKQELPKQEEPKPQPTNKRRKRKPAQSPPVTAQGSTATTTPATPPPSNASNTTVAAAHPPPSPAETPTTDIAISADVTSAQLSQQKQTTAQLLDSTEKTLNGLGRSLSSDETEVVSQVRSYMGQSRKATSEGDFERAYNLATKAHLLSDALVKK